MKKYLPALIAAFLVGVTVNSAYAAGNGDVDDVTMNVIDQNNTQDVTSNIQLPDQASPEAAEHVNGTMDDDKTDVDNKADDVDADAQAAAQEEAHEDSHAAAEEQAHQAMQDAKDASSSTDH